MSQQGDPIKAGTMAGLYDRYLFDVEEKQRIERAAQAVGYGFNPYEFARPFPRAMPAPVPEPAPVATVKQSASMIPMAAALILGGGTLGAGAVGLASMLGMLSQSKSSVSAVTPTEYEVIFESEGKQIDVERKK